MPAIEGKYGVITSTTKEFHPGEPVFLLRSTDKLAVEAILEYLRLCRAAGCSKEHCAGISDRAERVLRWQHEHRDLVKLPD